MLDDALRLDEADEESEATENGDRPVSASPSGDGDSMNGTPLGAAPAASEAAVGTGVTLDNLFQSGDNDSTVRTASVPKLSHVSSHYFCRPMPLRHTDTAPNLMRARSSYKASRKSTSGLSAISAPPRLRAHESDRNSSFTDDLPDKYAAIS